MAVTGLTDAEIGAICNDLEHGPFCAWGWSAQVFFQDDAGDQWADELCTVPYIEPTCDCGFFALRESAKAKLRSMRGRQC